MKLKFNALVAAAAFVAAGGVQAAIDPATALSFGNSSVLFVAVDRVANISFSADLGLNMINLLPGAARTSAGATTGWSFPNNTTTDLAITGNAWSAAYATFLSTATAPNVRWGVIAGDNIQGSGLTVTLTNVIAGRGWLATGTPTIAQMTAANTSAPTGNGLTAIDNFWAATTNLPAATGNFITANNGAGTATSGFAYGAMVGTFSGPNTWNYLTANGVASTFQYQRQTVANPAVFQIGGVTTLLDNTFNDLPTTFNFDFASGNLVMATPVPEPGTYAMLLAGLAAVGFMARRRSNRA